MAMWDAAASVPERDGMRATGIAEPALALAPPTEADGTVADYRHVGLHWTAIGSLSCASASTKCALRRRIS